ncbi:MAG TPA: DNA cytosine methyltransferase, partial [Thermoanaerobaculia bacterium]|nr:DNA cytosine methyltransferase [Thermoanaerobaculia bacterium]
GYALQFSVLNSSDFGVPQLRKRIFVIGRRSEGILMLPSPQPDRVTVAEAISDLPRLDNGASTSWMPYRRSAQSDYAKKMRGRLRQSPNHFVTRSSVSVVERYKHIPPGRNWTAIPLNLLHNYSAVDKLDLHTGLYHRLRADQPSVVIGNYRKNMLIHPEENRGLSVREAARIQSFPDDYEFVGSIGFQQQQVGNAVPPLLARAVFESLLSNQ